jgi:hypothetical protein
MADRPEPRVKTELPVRVWGMGKDGRPFFQNAEARNISSEGAMISGLDQQLTPGDTIGLQYGDKKARFRVIWVIEAGLIHKIQAGVQLLGGQACPWRNELDAAPEAAQEAPSEPSNKRKFERHKIRVPLELSDDRGGAHMLTNATDMTGRGCYVETLLPLPVGRPLQVTFWIDSEKITSAAVVRASDGGVGMGIEFIGLDVDSQNRVQRSLEKAAADITGLGPEKS